MLFVRNLANSVTEEILEKSFSQFGKLERVKKLKDYAFIHFDERDGAVKVCFYSQFHLFSRLVFRFRFCEFKVAYIFWFSHYNYVSGFGLRGRNYPIVPQLPFMCKAELVFVVSWYLAQHLIYHTKLALRYLSH